ncbi:MAG TPA: TetR/AcrR family transcriptional regulator [Clostridia bacterium]|nr:TetR/AcrR family transcriptional regulator [Clostridia bacterium]
MQYLKKEIRERIVDSAVDEFYKLGYSDASIRNIAQTAKVSLGNVYRYFANKETLYLAVINPVINAAQNRVDMLFMFTTDTFDKVPHMIVEFINEYANELSIVTKGSVEHYEKFTNAVIDSVSENINKLIAEQYPAIYRKIKNPDFHIAAASSFVHGLFFIVQQDSDDESKIQYIKEYLLYFFGKFESRL